MKRVLLMLTSLLLILTMPLPLVSSVYAASTGFDPLRTYVRYEYNDGNNRCSSGFYYSDEFFLKDAEVFSPELAKMGVALAAASYERDDINSVLGADGMGFTSVFNNAGVYERSHNLTYTDNDHVAYSIMRKVIGGKTVYVVPVKGTSANEEWYSDFNLGNGTYHEGFRKAELEVREDLERIMNADGCAPEDRVLFFTGHSRGAAVANLLAGEYSVSEAYAPKEQIFGYTYACPSGTKSADKTLKNIFNFNHPGDLVPLLPLKSWGYDTYGTDRSLIDDLCFANMGIQFERATGRPYQLERSSASYMILLNRFVGNQNNFYNAEIQAVLLLAASALGGCKEHPGNWVDVVEDLISLLSDFLCEKLQLPKTKITKMLVTKIKKLREAALIVFLLQLAAGEIKMMADGNDELIAFIQAYKSQIYEMTDNEFELFLAENFEMLAAIEELVKHPIVTREQFAAALYMSTSTHRSPALRTT